MRALAAAVVLLALAGCAAQPSDRLPAFSGDWVLEQATDAAGPIELDPTHPVTLQFGDTVGGTAACNSYGAEFARSADGVAVTNLSQTEMACEPASVMEVESRYLAALAAVTSGAQSDLLTLTGPDVSLTFIPADAAAAIPLVGTTWALVSITENPAPDAAASSPLGNPTLLLTDDGRVEVVTGCNGIGGRYEISGAAVTTSDLSSTLMGCELPLAEQEMQLRKLVDDSFEVQQPVTLNSAQLIVTSDDGSLTAKFTAQP